MVTSLVAVVEYLETSMSRELLYKFPDNSAFDFEYAQSSIWSPLLPPPLHSDQETSESCGVSVSRKLQYKQDGFLEDMKKITAKFKREFTNAAFGNLHRYQKMNKRRRSMEFSSVPPPHQLTPTSPTPRKVAQLESSGMVPLALLGWAKVLKAASKHFKKNKRRDPTTNSNVSKF